MNFDSRFTKGDNQVFIAMNGDPQEMANKLRQIAREIESHGKPIQTNLTTFKLEVQIKTPIWGGKDY